MLSDPTQRRWLIRLAGSALVLAILFWILPAEAIVAAFKAIPIWVFLSVLVLFLLAHVGAALKWWLLLGRGLSPLLAVRAHFAGLAANLCLPGAIGGDTVRAGMAQAAMKDGARVVAGATVDRLIDMVALLTLSCLGLVLTWERAEGGHMIWPVALVLLAALAGMVALPRLLPLPWRYVPSLPGKGFARRLADALTGLGRKPGTLAAAFIASVLIQLLLVMLAWWLAIAAGVDVATGPWIFAWPLAKIIAVLPVSLNGLGLREATLAGFLTPFGASAPAVVAAGLVWQIVLFTAGGFGALVLTMSGMRFSAPANSQKEECK
ncbi:lysylphosphatidylglycerol synthase transmembrane domain-containing protein [Ruegeria atlantica]|uniref:lysylphosphatidylglycerol synthase transmembrane domain-containing protein n=1 Tax=Ruegeria atlantica TaxID=81569 RepID=UPI00147E2D34|nr:lysylphosphatidylglycerol synthase transmembrane domain-containing protein [Ruegeria atlantica]